MLINKEICKNRINPMKFMRNYSRKLQQLLCLLTCVLMVVAVSIRRDGKVAGHDVKEQRTVPSQAEPMAVLEDGSVLLNTTELGKDIVGYGGNVPLEITLHEGRVESIRALANSETPHFFEKASALLDKWNGQTIEDAQKMKVDAVTGATFSSKAIIGNVQRGLQYAAKNPVNTSLWSEFDFSAKAIAGLVVVLLAAIVPLFVRDRRYRMAQQMLNVVVLGFWCGSFLNYTSIISYMSNGMNVVVLIVPLVMLITAFVYPLFGKKSYYCTHVCPFGSLQELAGKCVGYKVRMKPSTAKRLDMLRQILWAVLMLCLWTGVWFDWIDYEPFTAFVFQSASWVVIAIAIAFVALSTIIVRPYCRFVCPMGTLLKFSQLSTSKRANR